MRDVPDDAVPSGRRYDRCAAAIHWITAALLLVQFPVGFVFHAMERGPVRSEWFAWHKTIGAAILVLTLVRLAWRLRHAPPPLPPSLPRWRRRATLWSHRLFYFMLIVMPLSGLLAVSAYSNQTAIALAGGLRIPVIPWVSEGLGESAEQMHKLLVTLTLWLIALHLLAAVRHQFAGARPGLAGRMPPLGGRGESVRRASR